MKKCSERIERNLQMGKHTIRVVCLCSQGRHRSVAVASTLQAVYEKMGYNSIGPTHLSKDDWWKGMCFECEECKPNKTNDRLFTNLALDFEPVG